MQRIDRLQMKTLLRAAPERAGRNAKLRGRVFAGAIALLLAGCASVVPEPPESIDNSLRFIAQSGILTVEGRFGDWRVVESKVDRQDLAASFVLVEIDVASIDTGVEGRDDHLRDPDFFEVERWPTATVRVGDVRPTADPHVFDATYGVTIKDREQALAGSFRIEAEAPLVVSGEVEIDRVAFGVGVAPSRFNPFDPHSEVQVMFRLTLD